MSSIDNKFEQYLNTLDQVVANMLRAAVEVIPQDQRRKFIIDNCPVKAPVANDANSDMAEHCLPEEPKSRIWTVEVCRTTHAFRTMKVVATTEQEACENAIDAAGDVEFGSGEADYSTPDGAY